MCTLLWGKINSLGKQIEKILLQNVYLDNTYKTSL